MSVSNGLPGELLQVKQVQQNLIQVCVSTFEYENWSRYTEGMNALNLTSTQQELVTTILHRTTSVQRLVKRARILIEYEKRGSQIKVAAAEKVDRDTVAHWLKPMESSPSLARFLGKRVFPEEADPAGLRKIR
jgi:uncharacterized protein involved in tellurium resistance